MEKENPFLKLDAEYNASNGVDPSVNPFLQLDDEYAKEQEKIAGMGDTMRGLNQGWEGTKGMAYGLAGATGAIAGSEGLKRWGLDNAGARFEAADAYAKPTDSVTNISGVGDAIDWAQHGVGYLVPMVAPSILSGGVGAIAGRSLAEAGVKGLAKAEASKALSKAGVRGAVTAAGATSYGQELGSIYPDMVAEGHDEVGRAAAFALPAAALDIIPEARAIKHLLGGAATKGLAREVVTQSGMEAVTETGQSAIERAAAYKPLANSEALTEYADSAALGALGGGLMGAVGYVGGGKTEAAVTDTPIPDNTSTPTNILGGGNPQPQPAKTQPEAPTDPVAAKLHAVATGASPFAPITPEEMATIQDVPQGVSLREVNGQMVAVANAAGLKAARKGPATQPVEQPVAPVDAAGQPMVAPDMPAPQVSPEAQAAAQAAARKGIVDKYGIETLNETSVRFAGKTYNVQGGNPESNAQLMAQIDKLAQTESAKPEGLQALERLVVTAATQSGYLPHGRLTPANVQKAVDELNLANATSPEEAAHFIHNQLDEMQGKKGSTVETKRGFYESLLTMLPDVSSTRQAPAQAEQPTAVAAPVLPTDSTQLPEFEANLHSFLSDGTPELEMSLFEATRNTTKSGKTSLRALAKEYGVKHTTIANRARRVEQKIRKRAQAAGVSFDDALRALGMEPETVDVATATALSAPAVYADGQATAAADDFSPEYGYTRTETDGVVEEGVAAQDELDEIASDIDEFNPVGEYDVNTVAFANAAWSNYGAPVPFDSIPPAQARLYLDRVQAAFNKAKGNADEFQDLLQSAHAKFLQEMKDGSDTGTKGRDAGVVQEIHSNEDRAGRDAEGRAGAVESATTKDAGEARSNAGEAKPKAAREISGEGKSPDAIAEERTIAELDAADTSPEIVTSKPDAAAGVTKVVKKSRKVVKPADIEAKYSEIDAQHPVFARGTDVQMKVLVDGTVVEETVPAADAVKALDEDVNDLTAFLKCVKS